MAIIADCLSVDGSSILPRIAKFWRRHSSLHYNVKQDFKLVQWSRHLRGRVPGCNPEVSKFCRGSNPLCSTNHSKILARRKLSTRLRHRAVLVKAEVQVLRWYEYKNQVESKSHKVNSRRCWHRHRLCSVYCVREPERVTWETLG